VNRTLDPNLSDENETEGVEWLRMQLIEVTDRYASPAAVGSSHMVSPVQFVVDIASHLGAPGKRLLQILGQYITIPPEFEEEFAKVYDALPGQSKLSGFHTARRYWPGMADALVDWGEPIGAGSLATVWEAQTTSGGNEVVRVLNPNVVFHMQGICDILREAFESLTEPYPEARLAVQAVEDIRNWIKADIGDERFISDDQTFNASHHGWRVAGLRYSVYIPRSYETGTSRLRREEFIAGQNLTQWNALEASGHDMRAIVATVARNFVWQIAQGQVLSNISPGNIRITADDQIAFLDRYFYLHLTPEDQALISNLWSGDISARVSAFVDYLAALPGASGREQVDAILATVSPSGQPDRDLIGILSAVKAASIDVPLRITLMVNNALTLNNLAKRAGFASLAECLSAGE
jgi:hypothetical protein